MSEVRLTRGIISAKVQRSLYLNQKDSECYFFNFEKQHHRNFAPMSFMLNICVPERDRTSGNNDVIFDFDFVVIRLLEIYRLNSFPTEKYI